LFRWKSVPRAENVPKERKRGVSARGICRFFIFVTKFHLRASGVLPMGDILYEWREQARVQNAGNVSFFSIRSALGPNANGSIARLKGHAAIGA